MCTWPQLQRADFVTLDPELSDMADLLLPLTKSCSPLQTLSLEIHSLFRNI